MPPHARASDPETLGVGGVTDVQANNGKSIKLNHLICLLFTGFSDWPSRNCRPAFKASTFVVSDYFYKCERVIEEGFTPSHP